MATSAATKFWRTAIASCLLWALTAIALPAQTLSVVTDFDGTHGANPGVLGDMRMIQGLDGNLYGTTFNGGANDIGVVFKLAGGTLSTLHDFAGGPKDGRLPVGGLVLSTSGNFYGTTAYGGTFDFGTVYTVKPKGKLKTLHIFDGTDGNEVWASLIQGSDGRFYGTAQGGGGFGVGTVYKITGAGAFATTHNFAGGSTDGAFPVAPLVQGTDGNFYGTSIAGGTNNQGTVFQMTSAGVVKWVHSFTNEIDGSAPRGGLVEGLDGNFYGTASQGGPSAGGSVFQITPTGTLTVLHFFTAYPGDGSDPEDTLVLGSDGNLYGTTLNGGSQGAGCNCGTIFRVTPGGTYTLLYSFVNKTDGHTPFGGLMQATDGNFYGTTTAGGATTNPKCVYDLTQTCGTIYSFSVRLGPFVKTLPTSAMVGKAVFILGNNLTGTTAVSINGKPASFTVVSDTEIKTKVPAGATTGPVTVTTPGGTLTSNVPFQIP